jgi:hypothetical protein
MRFRTVNVMALWLGLLPLGLSTPGAAADEVSFEKYCGLRGCGRLVCYLMYTGEPNDPRKCHCPSGFRREYLKGEAVCMSSEGPDAGKAYFRDSSRTLFGLDGDPTPNQPPD